MYKVVRPAGVFWVKDMLRYQSESQPENKPEKGNDFQERLDREIDKLRGKA